MKCDFDELRELVRFMNENGLVELEIADSAEHIRLKRPEQPASGPAKEAAPAAAKTAPDAKSPQPAKPTPEAKPAPEHEVKIVEFVSPMVGTFRRGANAAEPFVKAGSKVDPSSVLCIIEAMSVPNEIKSSVAGMVMEVLAEEGQPVEFGTPLFRILPSPPPAKT